MCLYRVLLEYHLIFTHISFAFFCCRKLAFKKIKGKVKSVKKALEGGSAYHCLVQLYKVLCHCGVHIDHDIMLFRNLNGLNGW